jgi:multiple sugar transport system permease protein
MNPSTNAVFWILALALSFMASVYLLAAIMASVRALQPAMIGLSVGLALAFAAGVWGSLRGGMPWVLCIAAFAVGIAAGALTRRMSSTEARAGQTIRLSAAHLTLVAGSIVFLIPFVWLISTSLKTDDEMAVFPPVWIPTQQITSERFFNKETGKPAGISMWKQSDDGEAIRVVETADLPSGQVQVQPVTEKGDAIGQRSNVDRSELTKIRQVSPRWENYSEALQFLPPETHYGLVFLGNTLLLTLLSTVGTLLSSSLVAYSFARLRWPGKNLLFVLLLATMMVPSAVTMMPQFLIFRSLNWIDTLRPLWVPAFFGSAFNVFLLRQFFMSIPTELEDAAKIDGCGAFGIYWRIMLPMVKPAMAAVAIMSIMGSWNNFQGPLIYLSSPEKMPLAYALQLYQTQHGGEPGLMMAASTLMVLPIIVLFFFTQRYFIEGVSLSGLGGR